jgi:uncharacterized membrane protein
MKNITGTAIAIAAASLINLSAVHASDANQKVRCYGVNSCKGHGSCATANNQCAGQNSCRGKGIKDMTKAACEAAEGIVES